MRRTIAHILAGDIFQANIAERHVAALPDDFDAFAFYCRLRRLNPAPFAAWLDHGPLKVACSSPERFLKLVDGHVETRPIKGTIRRSADCEDDARLAAALLASDKDRAENVMIVDLMRSDLSRVCRPHTVAVPVLAGLESYETVHHLVSVVTGELEAGCDGLDLIAATFPGGSITGAPKIRAMRRIAELESAARNLYTGALGWVAPTGDCRFNVAIRTFEVDHDGSARLGVGSGIVIDADPAREYAECLLKARFLTGFDPGFELIETMRLEHGRFPMQSGHLDRLKNSARALGFALDERAVATALTTQVHEHPVGVFRVRLSLAHSGAFKLAVAELDEPVRNWRVVIAEESLPANDYLRAHKTTVRGRYDAVLGQLAEDVFDAIFLNEQGEVCEGARSNVFIVRDGQWLTPSLKCGLLPGVMRRSLLESGRAIEQVLYREDLLSAEKIYLANALRGVIPVRF